MTKPAEEDEVLRQIGEMWDAAKAELQQLRESAERAVQMGEAQAVLNRARSQREEALLRLGDAFYKLVEGGEVAVPAALKRAYGDVKMKDIELLKQQADIAAIIKEADTLIEKPKKPAPKKKLK